MKKQILLCITFVLLLCFFLLDCSSLFPECSASIRIYSELDSDIFVTIDEEKRRIPGWGACKDEELIYTTVACSAYWYLRWPKPSNLSCTEEETTEPEPECEGNTYSIVVDGMSGLDRSIFVNNEDYISLTVDSEGWK
jgi:hypothetical protein